MLLSNDYSRDWSLTCAITTKHTTKARTKRFKIFLLYVLFSCCYSFALLFCLPFTALWLRWAQVIDANVPKLTKPKLSSKTCFCLYPSTTPKPHVKRSSLKASIYVSAPDWVYKPFIFSNILNDIWVRPYDRQVLGLSVWNLKHLTFWWWPTRSILRNWVIDIQCTRLNFVMSKLL